MCMCIWSVSVSILIVCLFFVLGAWGSAGSVLIHEKKETHDHEQIGRYTRNEHDSISTLIVRLDTTTLQLVYDK